MLKELFKLFFSSSQEVSEKPAQLDECLDGWKKYRDQLIAQKRDLEKQIDKTVFAISSGAIGISLVIIDKLSPENKYILAIIALAWVSLVISLIYQCLSFLKTSASIKNSISKVEEIVESDTLEKVTKKEEEYYNDWQAKNSDIDKYNKHAFKFMILGIVMILLFSFLCLFVKEQKPIKQINLTLPDSIINKIVLMSKAKSSSDSSNKSSSKGPSVKLGTQGKLTVKQAEQIVAPPVRTKPK